MAADVKRYDLTLCSGDRGNCNAELEESSTGEWVEYAEWEKLSDKLEAAESDLEIVLAALRK